MTQIILGPAKGAQAVLPALQRLQNEKGYLPKSELEKIAKALSVPKAKVFSLATFYQRLSLYPKGKVHIELCQGTACHVLGGLRLLEELVSRYRLRPAPFHGGFYSEDRAISIETVRCLGCCSLSPVVKIGSKIIGRVDISSLEKILHDE